MEENYYKLYSFKNDNRDLTFYFCGYYALEYAKNSQNKCIVKFFDKCKSNPKPRLV